MIFTLEALEAKFGDSLILHYGQENHPRFIVIDGGPSGVYRQSLAPRLAKLREKWAGNEPLDIEMVMVSHLDSDHVKGIVDWTAALVEEEEQAGEASANILTLWHNTFDDIVGNDQDGVIASLSASIQRSGDVVIIPPGLPLSRETGLVLATVAEGRGLRQNAEKLNIDVNPKFGRLVMAPKSGKKIVDWGDGLKFTVVSPSAARLAVLQVEWDKKIKELKTKGKLNTAEAQVELADYLDKSPYNLSSIVVLAECGGKRMLLTGDARGDFILEGLQAAGLVHPGAKCRVDLLKIQHHGSAHDTTQAFFETVVADHYVISANGKYGNPDTPTLQMLSDARGNEQFTLYLTNKDGEDALGSRLAGFFKKEKAKGKKCKVVCREDSALSVRVDLLKAVNY